MWIAKIRNQIEPFPVKTTHYSSRTCHYLDSSLNVKLMYSLFLNKHPELHEKVPII